MNEGGADENGSLSFSQLLYHYRYGKNPCTAHAEAGLNLYHPGDNLKTLVVHTASDNSYTTGSSQNCEGGLHKAFIRDVLKTTYSLVAAGETVAELRGYIHPGQETPTTLQLTDREDDYEGLAKAIGIYNGNGSNERPIFTNRSWAGRLRYMQYDLGSTQNTATVCHSCKYSLKVRNKAGTFENHLRQYIWQGGTYPADLTDAAGNPDPRAGQAWCFGYGESEWINPELHPITGSVLTWQGYRDLAVTNISRRISCE